MRAPVPRYAGKKLNRQRVSRVAQDSGPLGMELRRPRARYSSAPARARPYATNGGPNSANTKGRGGRKPGVARDRKSTRLNSSHLVISYAVFCLKKKKHTTSNNGVVSGSGS